MIVYELICTLGHRFEGWFEDAGELERQLAEAQLSCPVCGDEMLRQVPAGFNIAKRRGSDEAAAAALLGQAVRRYLVENFEDVGPQFAKEALKIHYGVKEPRNIRGVSTPSEEKVLQEEGVSFVKIGAQEPSPHPTPDSGGEEED
ncbi:MAG: DUF1178 family protein [Deltaproteobacteria bacterium]|nr:DUF1178 family protein [Deltaproteobacteria bacterium]